MKLKPLTVSQEEYDLILEQIKFLSNRIPAQLALAKAKIMDIPKDGTSIKLEGDDLWNPIPWMYRWDEPLECWYARIKDDRDVGVACHKKITKRLALGVSSSFPPVLYTQHSAYMWGIEDLQIK